MSSVSKWIPYTENLTLHCSDVYSSYEYHKVFELLGDGYATVFYFEENDNKAFYPFMVNSVNKIGYQLERKYYDIQGVYGYGGVISNCYKPSFINAFYNSFYKHCQRNDIISEFVRFNPLLETMIFSRDHLKVCYDRETVVIDLKKDYNDIWNSEYTRKNRHRIRKAINNGYHLQIIKNPDEVEVEKFMFIYNFTMEKVNAAPYYFFNKEFFYNIFRYLRKNVLLFNVLDRDNEIVCSSIFLQNDNYLHYHLMGRCPAADYTVNSYLIDQAVRYGISEGLKYIHLGGGRTSKVDDSLLKFKKEFSKDTLNYFIGKKIINHDIYNEVVKQWTEKYPEKSNNYNDILQRYRF